MDRVIVIVGPTAVGKTKLSIELAKYYSAEIISGDSAQIYRGLDIGTAKIKPEEMEGIPHHLLDLKEPGAGFSVHEYQTLVREKIRDINARGKIPIIVGGTGLYIRAVLYDYRFTPVERSQDFANQYRDYTNEELYERLFQYDQALAATLHPNNRRRVLRALEIIENENRPHQEVKTEQDLLYDAYLIGLDLERDILYQRINNRVLQMVEEGLVEEAQTLFKQGIVPNIIGYKELVPYFNGESDLATCIAKIQQNSRHLAKRQLTFFRHQFQLNWFKVDLNHFDQLVQSVKSAIDLWLKG